MHKSKVETKLIPLAVFVFPAPDRVLLTSVFNAHDMI